MITKCFLMKKEIKLTIKQGIYGNNIVFLNK